MACPTEDSPRDCVIAHWSTIPGLEKRRGGWRAPCPLCAAVRSIEVSIIGGRIQWNKHCPCDEDKVAGKLASS